MLEKGEKYDPRIYGELRAKYLKNLDSTPFTTVDSDIQDQEKRRQEIIEEIKEGKIAYIIH
jgi:alpha-L-arabinofuranosidase